MKTKTKAIIVLLEMENGDIHQVIMTHEQERAVKAVLQSIATVQVESTPLPIRLQK